MEHVALPAISRVLVTGGTGTFGQALTRMLLASRPDVALTIVSRSEYAQVQMRNAYRHEADRVCFALCDVRDMTRLRNVCRGHDLVIHAAALKHIAIGEESPQEAIATNVLGTQNVLQACIDTGVKRCVVLSSDKAVEPANLYGCTKMAAERLALVAAREHPGMRINVTRYGNVMGSRGSVLEVFRKAMAAGERLRVTDPVMTRFFMTITEAVGLVMLAAQAEVSGYLFVPMLKAFSVEMLVRHILQKSVVGPEDYEIIGIQPGEKLQETLLTTEESMRMLCKPGETMQDMVYAVRPSWGGFGQLPVATWYPYDYGGKYQSGELRFRMRQDELAARLREVEV